MIKGKICIKDFNKKSIIVVPNVAKIAREMTESSQIVLIIKRFFSLSIKDMIVFGLNNLLFLPLLLKMDYAAGVKVLCELEILKTLSKGKSNRYVLHNQMVDMAVALNNKKVVLFFFGLATKYNFKPGLVSYNPERLISYLSTFTKLPGNLTVFVRLNKKDIIYDYASNSNIDFVELDES